MEKNNFIYKSHQNLLPLILFCLFTIGTACNSRRVLTRDYFENGSLKAEYYSVNGKAEGLLKLYYPDGKLKSEANYKNGKQDGITKLFHENGNLIKLVSFRNGIQQDSMKTFFDDGNLHGTCSILNGEESGLYKEYYDNKTIRCFGHFLNGNKNGWWELYDSTRHIRNVLFYSIGKLVDRGDSSDYLVEEAETGDKQIKLLTPGNWEIKNDTGNVAFFTCKPRNDSDENYPLSINITVSDGISNLGLNQFQTENINGLKDSKVLLNLIERDSFLVDNNPAERIIFLGRKDDVKAYAIQVDIFHNNKIYVITCLSPEGRFNFYKPLFDEIISSLKFNQN